MGLIEEILVGPDFALISTGLMEEILIGPDLCCQVPHFCWRCMHLLLPCVTFSLAQVRAYYWSVRRKSCATCRPFIGPATRLLLVHSVWKVVPRGNPQ
jgi:hypothetical protein